MSYYSSNDHPDLSRYGSPPPRPYTTSSHAHASRDATVSGYSETIRAISPPPQDGYDDEYHRHAPPPSFHSHDHHHQGYSSYGNGSGYDAPSSRHEATAVNQQFDFRLDNDEDEFTQAATRYQSTTQHHARSDVDLELRLGGNDGRVRAQKGSAGSGRVTAKPGARLTGGAGQFEADLDEEHFDEEEGDKDEFEDSFEGKDEWDIIKEQGEEGDVGSPAISFAGGFGAPPQTAHLRRNLTNRRVKLTQGNLVLDCAIPTRLSGFLPRKGEDEFVLTRYTAVTCAPEDFNKNNYTLRPTIYNRQTELFIVVTLYNENEVLFCRTMHGIMKNIAQLCKRKKSNTWGPDGWKKVVVCLVADGRKAIHPRVLDCLSALGVYQEGLATNQIDDASVQSHIYEYTTQLSIAPDLTFKGLEKGIVPTQIMFCLKEKNAKKLNSHRWALQAFAPQLDPNVVMLIDVGTRPGDKSLYHLWKCFDLDSNVGGACGEICALKGKLWTALLNPLVAAQNFEYKISNILDKPLESMFGYITVLPGAFSAYRYIALKNDELGHGPLNSYFKGEHLAGHDADVFTSNMYLAEDRILCWELIAKRGHSWVLKFVKSARGETDVPDHIAEFISQRRRWLNGSFFAGCYALRHTFSLTHTNHSRRKVFALYLQAIYNSVNLLVAWFGLANYWCFLMILTSSLEDPSFSLKGIQYVNLIVQYVYQGSIVACFFLAMGNKPKSAKWKYMTVIILLGITTAYMVAAAIYCTFQAVRLMQSSIIMTELVISLLATYGCYVLASLIALDPWHLVTSMIQYVLFSPVSINLLNIYAFSNLHDFSWGTKEQLTHEIDLGVTKKVGKDTVNMTLPSDQADIDVAYDRSLHNLKTRPMIIPPALSQKQRDEQIIDYYQSVRTNILLAWVLSNALLISTVLKGDYASTFTGGTGNGRTQIYMVVILALVAAMSLIRFLGSTAYVIDRFIRIVGGRYQSRWGRKAATTARGSHTTNLTESRRARRMKSSATLGGSTAVGSVDEKEGKGYVEEEEEVMMDEKSY